MKVLLTILIFFISIFCFSQTKYYFSTATGDDTRSAAQAQNPATPWRSIAKLNTFFSSLVAGDSVLFNRGETFPGGIVATKGGTLANSIKFSAYGAGAKPIISGLTTVPNAWTSVGTNLWQSNAAVSALTTLRMVLVNGAYANISRFPNVSAANRGYLTVGAPSSNTTITNAALSSNWVGATVASRRRRWVLNDAVVSSQAGTTITFNAIDGNNPVQQGWGFFMMNHQLAADSANEWWYTVASKKIGIFSTVNPTTTVQVSSVDIGITIGNNSFLNFSNLQIQGYNSYLVSIGNGTNIVFNACDFKYAGTDGIHMNAQTANTASQVINCTSDWINNDFLYAFSSGGWLIQGGTFRRTAMIAGMGVDVNGLGGSPSSCGFFNMGTNSILQNNSILQTGYIGIDFRSSNGFGGGIQILRNYIDSFCMIVDDGGGIYTFTGSTNRYNANPRLIDHNIILHGVVDRDGTVSNSNELLSEGIYFDENTSDATISNNSIGFIKDGGIFLHGGTNTIIRGNTSFDCEGNFDGGNIKITQYNSSDPAVTNIQMFQNINVARTANGKCLGTTTNSGNCTTFFSGADSNCYARPIADNTTIGNCNFGANNTLAQWQTATGREQHSFKSPKAITADNQMQFLWNETSVPKTFSLSGTWIDMRNVSYPGTITLQPNTSAVIIFSSAGGTPLSATTSASPNPVTCFGGTSTVTVNATGGTPPYQYRVGAGSFGASNVFAGLVAGTYTFQVRDAASTIFSVNATITQPLQITISQSSGTILVNGGTTTTTVTASGGTGTLNYKLDGGSFQTSNIFSGVAAGTHTITVRDANLCTNTLTYTLTQPTALVVSAAATTNPLTCFGNTTTITVTASGATPPYTYSINGGSFQASNLFTNRGAGTYTLTAKDAANATATTTVTITQPTQITITESHTAILVNGGVSTVTITASGGTGTKTYSLDGVTFQSSNVFANKIAGNYTVTVKDANNCTNTLTFTITQPAVLVVSAVATTNPLTCFGNTTTITVTASGGTPPYQYTINGSAVQSSNLFTNRGAGTYVLNVIDAALNSQTTTLVITQPTQITISESHTVILINGGSSTVTVTASGGTGTLNYSIDGGSFQGSNIFNGVLAGNHTITVRDANLCTNTFSFTITQPTALVVSASVTTAIACNGGTGTITVSASGGTAPYQYKIGTGSFGGSPVFSGLFANTYTFTVQDAGGAIVSTTTTITQPALITISLSFGNAPATVTVTAGGGVGGFNYQLDAGSFQGSNVFSGVAAGNHTITVRDANSCTQSQSFTVGSALQIIIGNTAIACNGGSSVVTVGATGGTQPYTGTGQFSRTAGTYTFTVTDALGAVAQQTITITQPAAFSISVSSGTIIVNGGTTTSTITASGGTAPLNYSLDGGTFQSSNVFNNVAAGNHSVTVRDANLCTQSQAFSISQPGVLGITITPGTAIACNGGTTTITVAGSGGTTPYTYGKDGTFQASTLFSSVAAGTYTFSVKDAFNNQKDTIVTISQPSALVLSVTTGTIVVNGGTTTVTASGSGGTGGLQYKLDGGSYQGSGSFAGVSAGPHTVTLKDANNCTTVNTFSITQPDALIIGIVVGTAIACNGGITTVTVSGTAGTPPYTYGKNGTFQSGTTFSNVTAGTYTFSVKDAFNAQADTIITISQPSAIVVSVTTGTILVNGGTTTVTATASGGTPALQYKLDAGSYQGNGNFAGVSAGPHTVTVKDANNCTQVNTFSISQPTALSINVSITTNPLACYGDQTNVTVSGSGGTTPYTGTGSSNYSAGTYTITITDAFGAVASQIITITQAPLITLTQMVIVTPITTYGGTGDVQILSAGGTPISSTFYQYALDGGSYTLSSDPFSYTFLSITGGNHTVSIKDNNSCVQTFSFIVPQPPPNAQFRTRSRRIKHIYFQSN